VPPARPKLADEASALLHTAARQASAGCMIHRLTAFRNGRLVSFMKAVLSVVLLVCYNALSATTEQPSAAASSVGATNSHQSTYAPSPLPLRDFDRQQTSQSDVVRGKHFQVSGPLVHMAKSKSGWDVPRRFLHLINPFAKREPQAPIERVPYVSPNAWTTTVGWHPGASAFDDPFMRCDGGIGLITVSRPDR
jgi:hypothetical protein